MEYDMPEVEDFLDSVLKQDFATAAPTFADIMGDRIADSMEQEKVKLANQVFNGVDPEEREAEDQYELDLDDPNIDDVDEDELDDAAAEALDDEDDFEDGEMEDEEEVEEDSEEEE